MSYCKLCIYIHPVNSNFTIWHVTSVCVWTNIKFNWSGIMFWWKEMNLGKNLPIFSQSRIQFESAYTLSMNFVIFLYDKSCRISFLWAHFYHMKNTKWNSHNSSNTSIYYMHICFDLKLAVWSRPKCEHILQTYIV